jgi:2-oxo-4-hydroxy-4-carboxy--5-ureidoimidazoline (OHCU) decarboxylase
MSILVIIIISASVNDHNRIIRALPDMALKLASWPVVMILSRYME